MAPNKIPLIRDGYWKISLTYQKIEYKNTKDDYELEDRIHNYF